MKVGDYLFASRTSNRLIMLVVVSIIRISNGLARHHFRNDGTREEAWMRPDDSQDRDEQILLSLVIIYF